MDENVENYRMGVWSKKWWWPVFAFAVDASLQQRLAILGLQKSRQQLSSSLLSLYHTNSSV